MASIAQLTSEILHGVGQPNNHTLRERVRNAIIHTRNELIRRSYENHAYVDKIHTQRFKVSLITVNDGDVELPEDYEGVPLDKIKRTLDKVPRPIRLTNNLPFDRVSSVGYKTNREFPYIKETTARFKGSVPGPKNSLVLVRTSVKTGDKVNEPVELVVYEEGVTSEEVAEETMETINEELASVETSQETAE